MQELKMSEAVGSLISFFYVCAGPINFHPKTMQQKNYLAIAVEFWFLFSLLMFSFSYLDTTHKPYSKLFAC